MIKILSVNEENPAVYLIQMKKFEKTIFITFEHMDIQYTASINERLGTNDSPMEKDWFSLYLVKIENEEYINKEDLNDLLKDLKDFLRDVSDEYNEAIRNSYKKREKNNLKFLSYLNEETKSYQPEKDKSFDKILSDQFKSTFFDYTLASKLEIVENNELHQTEKIIKEYEKILLQIKDLEKEDLSCSLEESGFQISRRLTLFSEETKEDVPALYSSKWKLGKINGTTKTTVFKMIESGEIVEESSWLLFHNELFLSNYKMQDISKTIKIRKLINKIESIIASKGLSESFEKLKLNKDLFELNYRETIKTDYNRPHYIIRNLNNKDNHTVLGWSGSIIKEFNDDIDDLYGMID